MSTLEVVARHPGHFEVVAHTDTGAWSSTRQCCASTLAALRRAAMMRLRARATAARRRSAPRVLHGPGGARPTWPRTPMSTGVMAAIVRAAGLGRMPRGGRCGKQILSTRRRGGAGPWRGCLVHAERVEDGGATLYQVDSEHSMFQCLPLLNARSWSRASITSCSPRRGGPFTATDARDSDQACAHPNWVDGPRGCDFERFGDVG